MRGFVHPTIMAQNLNSCLSLKLKAGLVYSEDGQDNIESGNLDELIHEFVPRAHFVPSEDYQFSFLLASR